MTNFIKYCVGVKHRLAKIHNQKRYIIMLSLAL